MKYCFLAILLSIGYSCNISSQNEKGGFNHYLSSLEKVDLPLEYSTYSGLEFNKIEFDTIGFEKYKHVWTISPVGILYESEESITTLEYSIGDYGLAPFLVSYDTKGNKIDSLGPYEKSGVDLGYDGKEYVKILAERRIIVIDSIKKWDINPQGTDIISESLKVTSDTIVYIVESDGKIRVE